MAETTWSEDEAPAKKKGVPTWVWFCGAGCLAMIILAVVVVGVGISLGKKALDSDRQWGELGKIVPVDERPADVDKVFGNQFGLELYILHDRRGFQLQIQHHTGKEGSDGRRAFFESDPPEFPKNLGVMKFEDVRAGTVEVQGRSVRVVRVKIGGMLKSMSPKEAQDTIGDMMFVDLTPESDGGMLLLQIQRLLGGGPITDEEVVMLLKPFHVGPIR